MFLHNPFGPIFEKELRATSRRKRTYLLRTAYLGGLLMFLVLAYLAGRAGPGGSGGVAQRVMQQNQLGRDFFISFSLFCVGSMAMIGPVLTCTAISSERLHKTLHVLLMTPITSWQIITGKLFSRLLVALTLIGLSLPVVALVRLLGGVEVEQMFGVLALAAATAIAAAAMGLFISTVVNRAYAAILFSYAGLLVLWVLLPALVMVVAAQNGPPPWRALWLIAIISPLFSTGLLISPLSAVLTAPWTWCVVAQLGLATGLLACSAVILRRLQRREGSATLAPAPPRVAPPAEGEPDASTAPDAAARSGPLPPRKGRRRRAHVGNNPVLWRELGRPLFPARWQSRLAAVLVVLLLLVSYGCFASIQALDEYGLQSLYACGFNAVAWLVFGVLAGTAIAQEKESDTWTLLLATPLAGRAIVLGKIAGLYRRVLWPVVLVAAHFTLFALFDVISWAAVIMVIWIIFSFNTVWVASGVYLSLKLQKVTVAVISNLAIALVLYIGGPVLLAITTELTRGPDEWAQLLVWGLPYYYLVEGVQRLSPDFDPGRTFWAPGLGLSSVWSLVNGAALIGAVHLAIAGGIVILTLKRFNQIVSRAGQRDGLPRASSSLTVSAATG